MSQPRPLSNPYLRSAVKSTLAAGAVVIGICVYDAVTLPADVALWIAVAGLAVAYLVAAWLMTLTYQLGWLARERETIRREAGSRVAYPVDVDGLPVTAPVTGRLVVDDPVDMERP